MYRLKLPPWLVLLTPAIFILAVVVLVPLVLSLYSSFTAFQLTRPDSLYKWIGTFNYQKAAGDPNFWSAFGRTVLLLTIALNLEMLLGLGLGCIQLHLLLDDGLHKIFLLFLLLFLLFLPLWWFLFHHFFLR